MNKNLYDDIQTFKKAGQSWKELFKTISYIITSSFRILFYKIQIVYFKLILKIRRK